jgi:hypothetical protein
MPKINSEVLTQTYQYRKGSVILYGVSSLYCTVCTVRSPSSAGDLQPVLNSQSLSVPSRHTAKVSDYLRVCYCKLQAFSLDSTPTTDALDNKARFTSVRKEQISIYANTVGTFSPVSHGLPTVEV